MVHHLLLESTYWRGVYQLLSTFFSGFHDLTLPVVFYRNFNGVHFCLLNSSFYFFLNEEFIKIIDDVACFCQQCFSIIFGVCFFWIVLKWSIHPLHVSYKLRNSRILAPPFKFKRSLVSPSVTPLSFAFSLYHENRQVSHSINVSPLVTPLTQLAFAKSNLAAWSH